MSYDEIRLRLIVESCEREYIRAPPLFLLYQPRRQASPPQMSDLACNFCAHGNPEGSTFCNECGSPLNLTLCSRCDAINVVWATECSQCGAPLSSGDTEEMAAALTEIVQSLERAPTKVDPVLVALAKRLHTVPGAPVLSHEPQAIVEDPGSRAAVPNADPASDGDDGPLNPTPDGRATYLVRNPNRARAFLLVGVVAVAGAAYWMSVDPTRPPDPRPMTGEPPATASESKSSAPAAPAQTADTPNQSPTGDRLPTAGPLPSSAGSSESRATAGESISRSTEVPSTEASSVSPATVRESMPPGANVEPPAAGRVPDSVDAQAASQAEAAESRKGGTSKTTNTGATGDAHRTVTRGRTKEQAERDAIATQRLIARELADAPPAN